MKLFNKFHVTFSCPSYLVVAWMLTSSTISARSFWAWHGMWLLTDQRMRLRWTVKHLFWDMVVVTLCIETPVLRYIYICSYTVHWNACFERYIYAVTLYSETPVLRYIYIYIYIYAVTLCIETPVLKHVVTLYSENACFETCSYAAQWNTCFETTLKVQQR